MSMLFKFPVPRQGNEITLRFNNNIERKVPKFLFAKYSKKFRSVEFLKINEYKVKSKISSESSFDSFISACKGEPISFTADNIYDLFLLSTEFEATSILEEVLEFLKNNDIEKLIKTITETESLNDINSDLLNYAASKFNELIKSESFKRVNPTIIHKILDNENININNWSSFLDFAQEYPEAYNNTSDRAEDASFVYQYVDLNKLTIDEVLRFTDAQNLPQKVFSKNVIPFLKKICQNYNEQKSLVQTLYDNAQTLKEKIEETNEKLKETHELKRKLLDINKNFNSNFSDKLNMFKQYADKNDQTLSLLFEEKLKHYDSNPLKGIFHDIKNQSDLEKFVNVLLPESESQNKDFPISNLFDSSQNFKSMSYYLKVDKEENNWITFHLLNHKIKLLGIGLRTNEFDGKIALPKHFQILGSNDNKEFDKILDYYDKCNDLNSNGKEKFIAIHDFTKIHEIQLKAFSYIRYRQLEAHVPYIDNKRIIALSGFELFGILQNNNDNKP